MQLVFGADNVTLFVPCRRACACVGLINNFPAPPSLAVINTLGEGGKAHSLGKFLERWVGNPPLWSKLS